MLRDELLEKSANIIVDSNYASTSLLCRKLNIEYNRSIKIMDELEQLEIVSPFLGKKSRDILVKDKNELKSKLAEK